MAGRNNRERDNRLKDFEQGAGASPGGLGSRTGTYNGSLNKVTTKVIIIAAIAGIIYKRMKP